MLIPVAALQNEPTIYTVKDCIAALEKSVLPRYKDNETSNPAYTKQECFVVLSCYFQAGKLNPRLLPQEIDEAVQFFMFDALWVSLSDYRDAGVPYTTHPDHWFAYSFKRQVKDLTGIYKELFNHVGFVVYLTGSLFLTNLIRFCKLRTYRKRKTE